MLHAPRQPLGADCWDGRVESLTVITLIASTRDGEYMLCHPQRAATRRRQLLNAIVLPRITVLAGHILTRTGADLLRKAKVTLTLRRLISTR